MNSDLSQNNQDQIVTNDDVIQTENNSGVIQTEPLEETVAESTVKRRSSLKSIRSLSRNKIFPQKLPPIKKRKKMVKFNKIHQERSTSSLAEGFEVKWDNMSYIVEKSSFELNLFKKSKTTYKVILKCLSGSFRSSELTAVMGPSGAGKSTLLACVCGKRTTGVTGDITVRGCNRINVSIITQNDYLTDKITLREALLFASKVKNGKDRDHEEVIHNVINSLGLETVVDTLLGKCSGGQRRKISIALELVSNPNILILDEPTSGLDSSACYQIVENLKELTQHKKNPMAIVATIHQPSARVFNLFHSIYVISHNGLAIYHGPPDKLIEHLNRLNIFVPEYHNPADYIAEIASGEQGEDYIKKLSTNKLSFNRLKVEENSKPSSSRKLTELSHINRYSQIYHLFILMNRSFKLIIREPHLSWIRIIVSLIIGTMIGLLFGHSIGQVGGCKPRKETLYSSKPTDLYKNFEFEHKAIEENLGSIFFNCIFLLYGGLMPQIMVFPKEFNVVSKQYTNAWYSTFTYYLSKVITDLPIASMGGFITNTELNINFFLIIASTLYISIWYILSEQVCDLWRYLLVISIGFMVMLIGSAQGMICSALFSKVPVSAGYLGVMSTTPMLLLSGFFVRTKRIPQYLLPLTRFSYTKYAFESWVIAIYGHNRCWYPDTNQTVVVPPWLKFMKAMTATMIDHNDNDDDLNYDDDSGEEEDEALNDILALFSGTTVSVNNNNEKYESMVMSEFKFTDDMLLHNCITLLMSALVFQIIAYLIFVYKLKKTN